MRSDELFDNYLSYLRTINIAKIVKESENRDTNMPSIMVKLFSGLISDEMIEEWENEYPIALCKLNVVFEPQAVRKIGEELDKSLSEKLERFALLVGSYCVFEQTVVGEKTPAPLVRDVQREINKEKVVCMLFPHVVGHDEIEGIVGKIERSENSISPKKLLEFENSEKFHDLVSNFQPNNYHSWLHTHPSFESYSQYPSINDLISCEKHQVAFLSNRSNGDLIVRGFRKQSPSYKTDFGTRTGSHGRDDPNIRVILNI